MSVQTRDANGSTGQRVIVSDASIGNICRQKDGKIHFFFTNDEDVVCEVILNDGGETILAHVLEMERKLYPKYGSTILR